MNETLFLSLSHSGGIPRIDLHTSSNINEALDQLEKELFFFSKSKEKFIKIIYGIGEGMLKEKVIEVIDKHPLINSYHIGEEGFCMIEL